MSESLCGPLVAKGTRMRISYPLHTFTLFAAASLSAGAHAADAPSNAGIIVITANRAPMPLSAVGQSVTVIGSAEIRTRQTLAVVDLLRLVPGITIARNGGVGSVASVFIRGADSDQTVALIDGVKINDPASPGGGFNFGTLLVGNLNRIEVVRGSQSVIWGSQAIGGVVNMITKAPTEALAVTALGEAGWRNTVQLVGNASGRFGPVGASVGARWFRTDGFSTFNEDRGGTERDGFENFAANARFDIRLSQAVSIDLRGSYQNGTTDLDGFAPPTFAFGDTNDVSDTQQFVGYAGLNANLLDGRFRNRIAYALTTIERENRNPGSPGFQPRTTFDSLGRNERFEYQGGLDIVDGVQAIFGAERENSRLRTEGAGGPVSRAEARLDGVYLQLSARPAGWLSVNAGVRHDEHDAFGGATLFSANGSVSPNGGATQARFSYGEGFKAPSLFQLYSDFGNTVLAPESARSIDAGITQTLLGGGLEVGATLFRRTTRNQIDFVSCFGNPSPICTGRPFGTYDNIRRTRGEGVEIALRLNPTEALGLSAAYSFIDAKNRDTGRQLARRPQDSMIMSLDWQTPFGATLGGTIAVVGSSFENAANSVRLAGYTLVDVRASMPVSEHLELFGRVENLFDEAYETALRNGSPRRGAYVGARLRY